MGHLTMTTEISAEHIQPDFSALANDEGDVDVVVDVTAGYCREENCYFVEDFSFSVNGQSAKLDDWAEKIVREFVIRNIR